MKEYGRFVQEKIRGLFIVNQKFVIIVLFFGVVLLIKKEEDLSFLWCLSFTLT